MLWIDFAGQSSDDFDIVVTHIPPSPRPVKRVTRLAIPGRDGTLTVTDGTYEDVEFEVEMMLTDPDRIEEVQAWLEGSGDLVTSLRPDLKYSAQVAEIDTQYFSVLHEIKAVFVCNPFRKSVSPEQLTVANATIGLVNPSPIDALPTITFDGTIAVNGITYTAAAELTVDVEAMIITKVSGGVTVAAYSDLTGDISTLRLTQGENTITVTGNATITPNWRWL